MKLKQIVWDSLERMVRVVPERIRLLIQNEPLIVEMDYGRLKLVVHTPMEYYERRRSAAKEPDLVKWIEGIPEDAVFFDIGANIGSYSLIAAKARPSLRIFSLEPGAMSYADLCLNVKLNNFDNRIVPLPIALSNTTAVGKFHYSSVGPGHALHGLSEVPAAVFSQSMLTYRLDDLITAFHLPRPTHIKVDIDGLELAVLEGAIETLTHVKSAIIEAKAGPHADAIVEFLRGHGFRLSESNKSPLPVPAELADYANLLFIRS